MSTDGTRGVFPDPRYRISRKPSGRSVCIGGSGLATPVTAAPRGPVQNRSSIFGDRFVGSADKCRDRAVRFVFHPAPQAKHLCLMFRPHAKTDALYAAADRHENGIGRGHAYSAMVAGGLPAGSLPDLTHARKTARMRSCLRCVGASRSRRKVGAKLHHRHPCCISAVWPLIPLLFVAFGKGSRRR